MATSPRPGGYDQAIMSRNRTVTFLYILLRDYLPPGTVEGIMVEHVEADDVLHSYSNDFLAAYAVELERRLAGLAPVTALEQAHLVLRRAQAQEKQD